MDNMLMESELERENTSIKMVINMRATTSTIKNMELEEFSTKKKDNTMV